MPKSTFVFEGRMANHMVNRFDVDRCVKCGRRFVFGDVVVHKRGENGENRRFYHLDCWERLFIDL